MLKIGVYACQIFPECEEHNICMSLYIWGCLSHVYVSSSLFPGLLPYLVARRIQTCPSLGSPHTVTPLQRQSLPSAPHTPTSTRIWTISAPCTAARPSPWSQLPEGWALQMVSLRQFFHRSRPPDILACPLWHCVKQIQYMVRFSTRQAMWQNSSLIPACSTASVGGSAYIFM